ncbi:MAG: sodium:proton exchanger [Hamadaea sp.]|uniref:cation:proton antiporter n=1 Tax=Hamadaea sp. TaxID=2024425 RepID=UPI00182CE6E3|nr:cation:proton antiporter [Hamadaea sp.]NUR72633.1 sodium:proton exchanger [Hamadaea sp.]NUT23072.1 sodium:proton exchanger [Hamadaea sp.]
MTTDQILLGVALILALAVGSQLIASRLRIPALIVLLPVGFIAGATTSVVDPERLLGSAFQPLVSLSVAVILYDAGLGLKLRRLHGHIRTVLRRLITIGVTVTWLTAALLAMWLLGMSGQAALMIGAILVVSGPTVVGPLLNFVRPIDRLQHILSWEGSLIDPIGAILGAVVFHAIVSNSHRTVISGMVHFAGSVGLGLLGGVVGIGILWLILRVLRVGEVLGTLAQLAVVVGVTALCDVARDDSGLIAAILIGLALANMPGFAIAERRPFFETLVQLTLGLLFVSISATVTPASLTDVILPAAATAVVLIVVVRPIVALVSTVRTDLSTGERAFVGWMAPRGIVAAATASTFAPTLTGQGIAGAEQILPTTFLIIVVTVTVYGLTAAPVAKLLGVVRTARARPMLIGGEPWVVDLAQTLRSIGLEVVLWSGMAGQRKTITDAGLELAPGELIADVTNPAARIEGVTAVFLLTEDDGFNALAGTLLAGGLDGPIYRLRPRPDSHAVLPGESAGALLFGPELTRDAIATRFARGERTSVGRDATAISGDLLFRVGSEGDLRPVTDDGLPEAGPGDSMVVLR